MHICAGCRQKLLNRRQHRLHYLSGSADQLPIALLLAPALPQLPCSPRSGFHSGRNALSRSSRDAGLWTRRPGQAAVEEKTLRTDTG
jgi:hypothetical protein